MMQHVQPKGTADRGQDGLGPEESRKNEMSESSQHSFESGDDEMLDRAQVGDGSWHISSDTGGMQLHEEGPRIPEHLRTYPPHP